jgi:hypothetical protein
MAHKYRVTGVWVVVADSPEDAQNFVENAVAADGTMESELDSCEAEREDFDDAEEEEFEGAADDEGRDLNYDCYDDRFSSPNR